VQRNTERRLKRARSHSKREAEPAAEGQQKEWRDKRRMPPPPNLLGTTGNIDNAPRRQHRSRAEEPAGETRPLLQTIREQVVSYVDADTASTGLELEAEHWQRKEATAACRYTRALELRAQLTEEAAGQFQDGSHPDEQCLCTVDEAWAVRRAVDSWHRVHNVGQTGDPCHVILPNEGTQRAHQPTALAGPEPARLYNNPACMIRQSRERSVALTDSQGILDNMDGSREPYDGITQMIHIALADAADMDPEKSLLVKAGVKLKHPEPYSGGSDLEEFEGFVANILRWLKMNYLLGPTSIELQVRYMGTCLTGEAQEWYHRNIPRFNLQVRNWTLETVVQGLQKRFLHTLTYHHALNKFDAVMQGTKAIQELMNKLTKYMACMIQQPDDYMLRRRFVYVLRETLRNEVLKKGYNAETSSLEVLCDTARMIEEASRYNQGMW
jgi:hypothetical protein